MHQYSFNMNATYPRYPHQDSSPGRQHTHPSTYIPSISYPEPGPHYFTCPDNNGFTRPQSYSPSDSPREYDLPTTPNGNAGYDTAAIHSSYSMYETGSPFESSIPSYHLPPQEQSKNPNPYLSPLIPHNFDPRNHLGVPLTTDDNNYGYYPSSESGSDVSSPGLSIKQEPARSASTWSPAPRTGTISQAKTIVATPKIREASQRRRCHPAKVFCKICNNDFTTTFALARHAVSHTGARAFPCTKRGCDSRFSTDSGRVRHEKSPTLHKA